MAEVRPSREQILKCALGDIEKGGAEGQWQVIQKALDGRKIQNIHEKDLSSRQLQDLSDQLGYVQVRDLFTWALVFCEAADQISDLQHRLEVLFEFAKKLQVQNGNFWWSYGRYLAYIETRKTKPDTPRNLDENAADFCMRGASLIWLLHRPILEPKVRRLLRDLIGKALKHCGGRTISTQLTNMTLTNAMNLMLLGRGLKRPGIAAEGYRRFDRWCIYTWEWGIHEYCSSTYTAVQLYSLG